MSEPNSTQATNDPSAAEPYSTLIHYFAQEEVLGGWHDVASVTDPTLIPEMLSDARARRRTDWYTGKYVPVTIRLARRVITYTEWPETVDG